MFSERQKESHTQEDCLEKSILFNSPLSLLPSPTVRIARRRRRRKEYLFTLFPQNLLFSAATSSSSSSQEFCLMFSPSRAGLSAAHYIHTGRRAAENSVCTKSVSAFVASEKDE